MKKIFVMLLMTAVILCGCTQIDAQKPGRPRVVERITASYRSSAVLLEREYTDGEKLDAVLTYLRRLDPNDIIDDNAGETEKSDARIILHYSDSTTKEYRIYGNQYLQINDGKWQSIKAERGQELPLLLGMMESD